MLGLTLFLFSCATPPIRTTLECLAPQPRLETLWNSLQDSRAANCLGPKGEDVCDPTRREIERLSFVCPGRIDALMASAILAYDAMEIVKAQQLLDDLLSRSGVHPQAASLRARIALEEGNLPFASRFLLQQIKLSPNHAELREMLAATRYLSGSLPEAQTELEAAEKLGSPRWRIAYHLGLIAEAQGDRLRAQRLYEESLQLRPGWLPAQSRLQGLSLNPPRQE
jgi:predicted Zn-dependent protease